jgi:glycosyltransferase involved in cell wall biosynthesis
MDGGSTDGSVDIIRSFADRLVHWQSRPDDGQAAAINAGFEIATGDILCWLNSDDFLMPGALDRVIKEFLNGAPDLLLGNCFHVNEGSSESIGSDLPNAFANLDLKITDFVIQPSSFWTRDIWDQIGKLDTSLHFAFDWDWFIRASAVAKTLAIPAYLSAYRIHAQHKTGTGGGARLNELLAIYKRYQSRPRFDAISNLLDQAGITETWERNLKRLRLTRIRPNVMKLRFPKIYEQLDLFEVASVRDTLRNSLSLSP